MTSRGYRHRAKILESIRKLPKKQIKPLLKPIASIKPTSQNKFKTAISINNRRHVEI